MKRLVTIAALLLLASCSGGNPDNVVKDKSFKIVLDNVAVDGVANDAESVPSEKAKVETAVKLSGN